MYQPVIEHIDRLQRTRLATVSWDKELSYPNGPRTNADGLYWLYTNYSDEEILHSTPGPHPGAVNLASMVLRHANLRNICQEAEGGFRVVYNGIGGLGRNRTGGLRERILGEFRGGKGTGSLAIRQSSLSDLTRWRVSHVLWQEIPFLEPHTYAQHAEGLERLWRLHFGWPVLCHK